MGKNLKICVAFIDYVLEPDKPGRSGLSFKVWDMASELVNQGHEAHVIASYTTKIYPDERVIVHNFPAPPIGYRNIIGQLWILKRASDIAKRNDFDIIHAPEYISTAVFATLMVKTPLVLTVPGNIYQRIKMGHSYEWWYVQFLKWAARISAKKCASIIAISKEMKHWWEKTGSEPDRTLWIPNGVDVSRFNFVDDARNLLGLPADQIIFLYAGRFSTEKGLLDLLEAITLLNKEGIKRNFKVYLIGGGPLEERLGKFINLYNLGQMVEIIHWVEQKELRIWYSAADAYLLPSHSEGFSRTIPEAMSCGLPIIGTRITGTEDHIVDGINGRLFERKNVAQLKDILVEAINNPQDLKKWGEEAHRYAHKNLTWKKVMEDIIAKVYLPILE